MPPTMPLHPPGAGSRPPAAAALSPRPYALLVRTVSPYRWGTLARIAQRLGGLHAVVAVPDVLSPADGVRLTRYRSLLVPYRPPDGGRDYKDIPLGLAVTLARLRPASVISTELGPRTTIAAALRKLGLIGRLVVYCDLTEFGESHVGRLRAAWRRWQLRCADAVMVNGADGERYVRALLGDRHVPLIRAPYATEPFFLQRFDPRRPAAGSEPLRLIFVGRLVEGKGVVPFLQALRGVLGAAPAAREIRLTIAGDGPQQAPIRRQLETLVSQFPSLSYAMPGFVGRSALPDLLLSHDVLFLPSFSETWGMVVNEAMACGLPVLGSRRAQAVAELIRDGRNGWICDPADPTSMGAAIRRCLDTRPARLRCMGLHAHLTAARLHEDEIAARYVRALLGEEPAAAAR